MVILGSRPRKRLAKRAKALLPRGFMLGALVVLVVALGPAPPSPAADLFAGRAIQDKAVQGPSLQGQSFQGPTVQGRSLQGTPLRPPTIQRMPAAPVRKHSAPSTAAPPAFRPEKHYSGVQLQQGRVVTDEDWNEESTKPPATDPTPRHGAAAKRTLPKGPAVIPDALRSVEGSGPPRPYVLDRESGAIRFGDGEHGARPPTGSGHVRGTYRAGQGTHETGEAGVSGEGGSARNRYFSGKTLGAKDFQEEQQYTPSKSSSGKSAEAEAASRQEGASSPSALRDLSEAAVAEPRGKPPTYKGELTTGSSDSDDGETGSTGSK